jgi:hypothetical protein
MHIQATKKVLDFFDSGVTEKNADGDIFAWHATFEIVNRKKLFILMHDISRFCVLIYGLKKSDIKNLTTIIKETLYVTMKSEAYGGFMIKAYLDHFDKVTFGKTQSRSHISRLVWLRDYVLSYMDEHGIYMDAFEQPHITTIINDNFVTDDNYKTWYKPNHEMAKILESFEDSQTICPLDDDYFDI